jgi:hypothetical protein
VITRTEACLTSPTWHELRHTYATALVNAGVSLQSLMALLGHVSAEMSLRYGRLFDATVNAESERALTAAKAHPSTLPTERPGGRTPLLILRRRLEQAPAVKARLACGSYVRAQAQRTVRLRQHLRALPELPHRRRLPPGTGCATRRHRNAGTLRRSPAPCSSRVTSTIEVTTRSFAR